MPFNQPCIPADVYGAISCMSKSFIAFLSLSEGHSLFAPRGLFGVQQISSHLKHVS